MVCRVFQQINIHSIRFACLQILAEILPLKQLRQQDDLRTLPGGLPRATNIISGPSRTGDVELTMQLGAHGPRSVQVILVRP